MPTLSFMEEIKDKASRLLPSPFTQVVEETTSQALTSPDYENIMFICDQANRNTEHVSDVVRAVRRRIDNNNPKVQYFTVLLLDALIKNCYQDLHDEVADNKALQRALVNIAIRTPTKDGEFEAKKAALTLILNMSYWFIGAAQDKTKMLSKLADEVRNATTQLAFEDIESDPTYQLKRAPPRRLGSASTSSGGPGRRQQQQQQYARQAYAARGGGSPGMGYPGVQHQHSPQQRVVNAIPVEQYTGDQISGMLDGCVLLTECLNTAETSHTPVNGDELIASVAAQVRQQHRKLNILLSSGADMENLDVLLTVCDSQNAVLQRLQDVKAQQGGSPDHGGAPAPAPVQQIQPQQRRPPQQGVTSSGAVTATATATAASGGTVSQGKVSRGGAKPRQAMGVDEEQGEEMSTAQNDSASAQPAQKQTTIDDFFDAPPVQPAPVPAPSGATSGNTPAPGTSAALASDAAASTQGQAAASASPSKAAPAPYQVMNPKEKVEDKPHTQAEKEGSINNDDNTSAAPAQDDDFDQFLNSRLAKK